MSVQYLNTTIVILFAHFIYTYTCTCITYVFAFLPFGSASWPFLLLNIRLAASLSYRYKKFKKIISIITRQLQAIPNLLTLLCFFENIWHFLIILYWVSPYQLLLTLGQYTWCHQQRNAYWGWSIPGLGCKKDFRGLPVGSSPVRGLIVCVHVGGYILLH